MMSGSALLTDLYQLTMLQGYYELGMEETAVFEFFCQKITQKQGLSGRGRFGPGFNLS